MRTTTLKLLAVVLVVGAAQAPRAQTAQDVEAALDTLFALSGPMIHVPESYPPAVERVRSNPGPYIEGLRAMHERVVTEVEEPRRFDLLGQLVITASFILGAEAEAYVGDTVDDLVERGRALSVVAIEADSAFEAGTLDLPAYREAIRPAEAVGGALDLIAWVTQVFQSTPLARRVGTALADLAVGSSPEAPVHESLVEFSRRALESLAPVLDRAEDVRPQLLCVMGGRLALFGYENPGGISTVPHGPDNEVEGESRREFLPPTVFWRSTPLDQPLTEYAFLVPLPETGSATWTLLGRSVTATTESPACEEFTPPEPPPVDEGADVRPVLECVAAHADGTYTAYFGYDNRHGAPVSIPRGRRNRLTPQRHDGPQPTAFDMPNAVPGQPGRTAPYPGYALAVPFDRGAVVWHLGGRTATANRGAGRRCPSD